MAVYTKVSEAEVAAFLAAYDLGALVELAGIKTGISNSNYRLRTERGTYILTLYENNSSPKDLDYFIGLMDHLAARGIPCPLPIHGRDGRAQRVLAGKPSVIVSFLNGTSPQRVQPEECVELGKTLAAMHLAGEGFAQYRPNPLSLAGWERLFALSAAQADTVQEGLEESVWTELEYLRVHWPDDLPQGAVHTDVFPDNVFFDRGKLCGVIDFNFACDDTFAYDIAVCLNAWCFENNNKSFNITKAKAMLQGYATIRFLSVEERRALPLLVRGAALRFLLTRLYDWLNQVPDALVKPKDPLEYLARLKFHQRVTSVADYGLDG